MSPKPSSPSGLGTPPVSICEVTQAAYKLPWLWFGRHHPIRSITVATGPLRTWAASSDRYGAHGRVPVKTPSGTAGIGPPEPITGPTRLSERNPRSTRRATV